MSPEDSILHLCRSVSANGTILGENIIQFHYTFSIVTKGNYTRAGHCLLLHVIIDLFHYVHSLKVIHLVPCQVCTTKKGSPNPLLKLFVCLTFHVVASEQKVVQQWSLKRNIKKILMYVNFLLFFGVSDQF